MALEIIGMDHIQIAMPAGAETQARHFYGELLGLTEMKKPPELAMRGGCWFEGMRFQIHLGVEKEFSPARKAHPAFLVNDLESWQQHLEAADVTVTPDETLPDRKRFYVNDPFGNRIEFLQTGDGFSQRKPFAKAESI